jgi:hypothetical protein
MRQDSEHGCRRPLVQGCWSVDANVPAYNGSVEEDMHNTTATGLVVQSLFSAHASEARSSRAAGRASVVILVVKWLVRWYHRTPGPGSTCRSTLCLIRSLIKDSYSRWASLQPGAASEACSTLVSHSEQRFSRPILEGPTPPANCPSRCCPKPMRCRAGLPRAHKCRGALDYWAPRATPLPVALLRPARCAVAASRK